MATTTTTTTTTTTNQISVYGHPSPVNSTTTTPANYSPPTSPRLINAVLNPLPLQSRQLRPPKGPLYVPAALRPTERPQRSSSSSSSSSSPPTPPRSGHGSLDSLNDGESNRPITRRSTIESRGSGISKLAEDEWMRNEHLGEVTGLPTREHWKVSSTQEGDSPRFI